MADPRVLLATAIDDSAEALYRIVADIRDPVAKARAALSAVDQIQDRLLPDMVSIRRAAIRETRQRMSTQELADRLGDVPIAGCTQCWPARTTRPIR